MHESVNVNHIDIYMALLCASPDTICWYLLRILCPYIYRATAGYHGQRFSDVIVQNKTIEKRTHPLSIQ